MADLLTPEVRQAEKEIDSAYLSNPLLSQPFPTSAWHVLTVAEDITFLPRVSGSPQTYMDGFAVADNVKNAERYAMEWLRRHCSQDGIVPVRVDKACYSAAYDLICRAFDYMTFCDAFVYASRGVISMSISGRDLIHTYDMGLFDKYEMCDKQCHIRSEESRVQALQTQERQAAALERIKAANSVTTVGKATFEVRPKPPLVVSFMNECQSYMPTELSLPPHWTLLGISIGDFMKVFYAIQALSMIRSVARHYAACHGCEGYGVDSAVWIMRHNDLVNRIVRYTSLDTGKVCSLVDLLTYGRQDQRFPDPSLQPLIPLGKDTYAIAPHLWATNSAERNFLTLANRVPAYRAAYSRLVDEKETIMRGRIESAASHMSVRAWHGKIPAHPNLPDVDLALVDDAAKLCLLTELKWFLEPADPHEVIERSEMVAEGVAQMLKLREAHIGDSRILSECAGVSADYAIEFAVVSSTTVGLPGIQSEYVPVVLESDFMKRLKECTSLAEASDWLVKRLYLPQEGRDFQVLARTISIAGWNLNWHAIEPLSPSTNVRRNPTNPQDESGEGGGGPTF